MISQRQLILRKARSMIIVGAGGTIAFGGIGIWTGNEKFFEQFLTPILNRMDPEVSHRAAIYITKFHMIRQQSLTGNATNLKTTIGPLGLSNPIGIAAGFDKSGECMSGLVRMGLGWIEIGSVTPLPQDGNLKPRIFRLPDDSAVINRYGFNNDGHEEVNIRVQKFKKDYPDYVIGVNLGANKDSLDRISDYCEGIKIFSDSADYFVINISSPNTLNLRDLQKSENLTELLKRVIATRNNQHRKIPLLLKIAPDLNEENIKSICKVVTQKDTKVDGLIISNTTIQRNSLKTESPIKNEVGGLSGRPLEKVSTELVRKFYAELKGEIPIIGVGGVWDGNDAFRKICAGASAIQMYTALTYKGPGIVSRIKEELSTLLNEGGFSSVTEAVGSDHRQTTKTI